MGTIQYNAYYFSYHLMEGYLSLIFKNDLGAFNGTLAPKSLRHLCEFYPKSFSPLIKQLLLSDPPSQPPFLTFLALCFLSLAYNCPQIFESPLSPFKCLFSVASASLLVTKVKPQPFLSFCLLPTKLL